MKSKRLVFRNEAEADLVVLYHYIAEASGSFETAFNFTERLRSACFKLEDFPEIGAPRDEIKEGLRILALERKTVITYFVKGGDVAISNIFHGGRDWEAFFIGDLERFPTRWNHLVEKESLQINMLEHVPTAKPLHTLAGHALDENKEK